ncbi:hypothetical protein ACFWWM_38150 [Streptomyces sp. NPDC058682]|uniref:hypothetical protein n=1 Tax=Streptomyces sp. NPDC058682 TaxID=3346596 RepID=UPI00365B7B3C
MAIMLGNILADWSQRAAAAVARDRATGHRPPATAEITRSLTQAVTSFRDENVIGPIAKYARAYRELRVPVDPDGKGRFGRLDVVVWLPGVPDLVVEIDSRPSPASAQKLTFARDAGAYPLWVRFGTGGIEKIDGVTVLDIRDIVQAVLDSGTE